VALGFCRSKLIAVLQVDRADEDVVEVIFVEDAGGADGTRENERRYNTHVSYCFLDW